MKKFLSSLMAAVCVVLCAFLFAACNTDDGGAVEVVDVTLDLNELTLTEGQDYTLTATITPSNATNQSMEWSSSNEDVATVDSGSVVAVAEGSATIVVTTSNGKTASCVVTVEAAEEEPPVQYTVTFYANGGEFEGEKDVYEMQVDDGAKLEGGVTVTRGDKYVFTNWYKDERRTNLWNFDEDVVTDDIELFAGWKYLNKYQSVIDALQDKIKAERGDDSAEVEILSVFTDNDGYLCFVEKDGTGAFSYKTDICDYDGVAGNAEIIAQIPNTTLTQLKAYNDTYTSANNRFIADAMAYKYTPAIDMNDAIIYSCVSEWKLYSEGKFATNGPWYGCQVKAIVADEDGNVYDCSFTAVAGVANFDIVIGGSALSEDVGLITIELGETANDFYSEYIKAKQA
ncbi:MAG: Ig-like domain-containing protein [Clostridiales bacterium]|nr:Ig-like domain-containing protein [Clostridiales bacterium]